MVLKREYVEIPVDGRRMRTFVAAPRDGGPHPGVVFYSDIFQLTEPTLRWAVRLAGYGFLVAVPEIYHRIEPAGTVLEFDAIHSVERAVEVGSVDRVIPASALRADLIDTIERGMQAVDQPASERRSTATVSSNAWSVTSGS